jgi:hypothetical protein
VAPSNSINSANLLGMLSTKALMTLSSILQVHILLIFAFHVSLFLQLVFFNWYFFQFHVFSIGLRSGELPGHLMRVMWGLALN